MTILPRILKLIAFIAFYLKEVVLCNVRVAIDVATPTHYMHPAIVAIPVNPKLTDFQLLLLSNLITMTPGTLSMEINEQRTILYAHVMYFQNEETFLREVCETLEKPILELWS